MTKFGQGRINNPKMNACIQAVWLQDILSEFDLGSTLSTVLFCDNQSAIKISIVSVTRHRTKHVEIHMHYIRELVHDMTIILQYYPTDEQIADIFTKIFSEKKFTYLCSMLGVSSSRWSDYFQCSPWGGVFPTGFSLFSSLRFISWALFEFHYCIGWPMALVSKALAFHALYVSTSPGYSLRGGCWRNLPTMHI